MRYCLFSFMAKKSGETIRFTARMQERKNSLGAQFYFVYPRSVLKDFGVKGTVRILGTANGVDISRALIPDAEGFHYIIFGKDLRKSVGCILGDEVVFEIRRDEDPDAFPIPEELLAALELEPGTLEKFMLLTPGVRRGMCYWVDSGKRPETRIKRALDMAQRLQGDFLDMGGRKIRLSK